jgi:hypothetical protein
MQPSAAAEPDEAAQTLEALRAAREAADRRLPVNWFAPVVVGSLLVLSSFLFTIWDGAFVALYWLVATPVALFAIKRHRQTELRTRGAIRDARPHVLVAAWFIVACVLFGAVGGVIGEPRLIYLGPVVCLTAAFAVFAWRTRAAAFVVWTVFAVASTVLYVVEDMDGPSALFAVIIGGNLALDAWSERRTGPA